MPRVKRGTVRRAKRKKLLGLAKGYYANKSKLYRAAKESVDTALKYAFVGRRRKKRDFRRLWVVRINAAAREHGLTYGQFINGLKNAGDSWYTIVALAPYSWPPVAPAYPTLGYMNCARAPPGVSAAGSKLNATSSAFAAPS